MVKVTVAMSLSSGLIVALSRFTAVMKRLSRLMTTVCVAVLPALSFAVKRID